MLNESTRDQSDVRPLSTVEIHGRLTESFFRPGAAPKERKALGAINGNTQVGIDKPAKQKSSKSKPVPVASSKAEVVVFEEGEQASAKVEPHTHRSHTSSQRPSIVILLRPWGVFSVGGPRKHPPVSIWEPRTIAFAPTAVGTNFSTFFAQPPRKPPR